MSTNISADSRIAEVTTALSRLTKGQWDVHLSESGRGDALDQLIAAVNQLAHTLGERLVYMTETERRFEEFVDVISAMAALDFTRRAPMGDAGTMLDALAYGINVLCEELSASTVSKDYVDNILESMNDALIALDPTGGIVTVNRATQRLFGYPKEELIGQPIDRLFTDAAFVQTAIATVHTSGGQASETTIQTSAGAAVPVAFSTSAMQDVDGKTQGIVCIVQDITERKRAEEALRHSIAQEETIRAQAEMLAELSTPLIPISDTVMVMPLIGVVDTRRAQQVLETLLEGIAANGAEKVILDITGVPVVDTQVANALLQVAQAVKLLGAQVVLTGIRPEVAQTLVGLGVDLRNIITHGTLQSGIAATFQR